MPLGWLFTKYLRATKESSGTSNQFRETISLKRVYPFFFRFLEDLFLTITCYYHNFQKIWQIMKLTSQSLNFLLAALIISLPKDLPWRKYCTDLLKCKVINWLFLPSFILHSSYRVITASHIFIIWFLIASPVETVLLGSTASPFSTSL